jgi:hypothetical protein
VSEYQCYEFLALEQPLTKKQIAELRAVSTRAEITPKRFFNEYHYGDFKGDAEKLVARYFDAHRYVANWGSRRLMLRLPSEHVALKSLRPYFVGEAAKARQTGPHVIIDLEYREEGCDYDEEEDVPLTELAPLRAELAQGDLRVAYLAWLLALQAGDVAEDAMEPPVPAGLSTLTQAQQNMIDFLRIDGDLVTAAIAASPAVTDDSAAAREWALALDPREKDKWLERALNGPEIALGAELLRTFRQQTKPALPRSVRRAAELLATAEALREKREQERARARPPLKQARQSLR